MHTGIISFLRLYGSPRLRPASLGPLFYSTSAAQYQNSAQSKEQYLVPQAMVLNLDLASITLYRLQKAFSRMMIKARRLTRLTLPLKTQCLTCSVASSYRQFIARPSLAWSLVQVSTLSYYVIRKFGTFDQVPSKCFGSATFSYSRACWLSATDICYVALVRTANMALVPAILLLSCLICVQSSIMATSAVSASMRAVACSSFRFWIHCTQSATWVVSVVT